MGFRSRLLGPLSRYGGVALFALLCSISPRPVLGQTSSSISGYITDQSGAVISGAAVIVKNLETGATRTTKSEANGNYIVLSLVTGPYEVTLAYPGFKAFRHEVHLSVGQEARLDVTLFVAAADVDPEIVTETAVVNTLTSDISGLVSEKQIK